MPGTTVFLVGTSGAGKSTLGNYLLYEVPCHDEGFLTGAGREGVTTSCESRQEESERGSPFKVVDTPGIPDPNGNNKTSFDCIVKETRDAKSLNAIIFVVDVPVNRKDVEKSTKNASVLLEQFNKTGCTLIMACRVVSHLPGLSVEKKRQTERYWNKYAIDISTAAGLRVSTVFYLERDDMVSQASAMRALVTYSPAVEITSNSGMQTFDELKRGVENRRKALTRQAQLEEDVRRLTRETAALQRTISLLQGKDRLYTRLSKGLQKAGAAIQCLDSSTATTYVVDNVKPAQVIAAVATCLILATTAVVSSVLIHANILRNISLNQATIDDNDVAVAAMQKELEGGAEDVGRQAADGDTLRKLNALD